MTSINRERSARRMVALVTDIDSNEQRLICENDSANDAISHLVVDEMHRMRSGLVDVSGRRYFVNIFFPSPRLIMIAAVHVSQVLASLAPSAGFNMIVIDPRTAFATAKRFRNVQVITEWPDTALLNIGLDRYTAIACLTHEPRIDDIALSMALRADCGYIGALGSGKSHLKRVERLENMGFSADDIERIHAPIGLDIGAASPAEIAVSILAEIVLSWRAKPLRSERPSKCFSAKSLTTAK